MSDQNNLTPEEERILEEKDLALRDEVDAEIAGEIEADFPLPPQPSHIMGDLETLALCNDAVLLSLGACRFTEDAVIDKFLVAIDPKSCQQFGLKIEADTVVWWLHPDRAEARQRWLDADKVDLPSALLGFAQWCYSQPTIAFWGNGAVFDNVKLRRAFEVCGLEYPFEFWRDHCYRTIKNGAPHVGIVREGVHHDPLDDAISQAKHLQAIWRDTDPQPLRTMLERCERQFEFYGQQHRAKVTHSVTTDADRVAIEKAEVNENLASEIRELLEGGR